MTTPFILSLAEYNQIAASHGHEYAAWYRADLALKQWQREHPSDQRDPADLIESADFMNWFAGKDLFDEHATKNENASDFGVGILDEEK